MKNIERLTDLEIKIMKVLWEHPNPMTIQQIAECMKEEKISVQSVTQAMQRMVKKQSVSVPEHILVSNVYARVFTPNYTQEEFMAVEYGRLEKSVFGKKRMGFSGFAAAFLNNADDREISQSELDELQQLIDRKKELIKKGEGR